LQSYYLLRKTAANTQMERAIIWRQIPCCTKACGCLNPHQKSSKAFSHYGRAVGEPNENGKLYGYFKGVFQNECDSKLAAQKPAKKKRRKIFCLCSFFFFSFRSIHFSPVRTTIDIGYARKRMTVLFAKLI
jgi:hypothetical protein